MSVAELLPSLRNLSREDKLKVIEFLAQELESEEKEDVLSFFKPGETYHVWSPFNSHGAAQVLAKLLDTPEQHD